MMQTTLVAIRIAGLFDLSPGGALHGRIVRAVYSAAGSNTSCRSARSRYGSKAGPAGRSSRATP